MALIADRSRPLHRSRAALTPLFLVLLVAGGAFQGGSLVAAESGTEENGKWLHHTLESGSGEAFLHSSAAFAGPFRFSVALAFMNTPINYGKMGGLSLAMSADPTAPFNGYVVNWIDRCACGPNGAWNFVFARYVDGVRSDLLYVPGYQQPHGVPYDWVLDVDNGTITLTVNDALIGSISDTTHAGPFHVGFWSRAHYIYSEQHIHLDDVAVENLTGVVFADDFEDGDRNGWTTRGGHWAVPYAPSVPAHVRVEPWPCPGQVLMRWAPPADDGGSYLRYRVYRGDGSGPIAERWPGQEVFGESDLAWNETRSYRVSAYNEAGEGPMSEPVSVTAPLVLPSEPRWNLWNGPAWSGPGRGEVSLAWYSPVERACTKHYRVYSIDDAGTERFLGTTGDGGWAYWRDSGLADGEVRSYQVSAVNAHGEGPRSTVVEARAPWLPASPGNVRAAPGADEGQVRVEWDLPSDTGGVGVQYRVYRVEAGTPVFVAETRFLGFVDSGREPGATVTYRVAAVNVVGEGNLSGEVSGVAQVADGPQEEATVVMGGMFILGSHATPSDVVIQNGGNVTFVAANLQMPSRPRGGDCFDFLRENGRYMTLGESYRVSFRYDAAAGVLWAKGDGAAAYARCDGWEVEESFSEVRLPFAIRSYYDHAGTITVHA